MRLLLAVSLFIGAAGAWAGPEEDRAALRAFYESRFRTVPIEAHADGVYAIDEGARAQWQEMEEFPPYEFSVDEGAEYFETSFADGTGYPDCFDDGAVKGRYPYFDETSQQVITLEMDVNRCREQHGEKPLEYGGEEMVKLVAYMAFQSRGQIIAVETPTTEGALAAYEEGKHFYTARRGQLNFACSSCHVQLAGNNLRAEKLSASVGHVTSWPTYRFKWEALGSLHFRFQECNSQVRAEPLELQSEAYRNLEYFLSYMANGLPLNGPASRK